MGEVTVDLVTQDPWELILVESGPWSDLDAGLRALQDRLYNCLDAAIDGSVAEKFPGSSGAEITIRVQFVGISEHEVSGFFERFSAGVLQTPDYTEALAQSLYVSDIRFVSEYKQ